MENGELAEKMEIITKEIIKMITKMEKDYMFGRTDASIWENSFLI